MNIELHSLPEKANTSPSSPKMKYTLALLALTLATFTSALPHPGGPAGDSWGHGNGGNHNEQGPDGGHHTWSGGPPGGTYGGGHHHGPPGWGPPEQKADDTDAN